MTNVYVLNVGTIKTQLTLQVLDVTVAEAHLPLVALTQKVENANVNVFEQKFPALHCVNAKDVKIHLKLQVGQMMLRRENRSQTDHTQFHTKEKELRNSWKPWTNHCHKDVGHLTRL